MSIKTTKEETDFWRKVYRQKKRLVCKVDRKLKKQSANLFLLLIHKEEKYKVTVSNTQQLIKLFVWFAAL